MEDLSDGASTAACFDTCRANRQHPRLPLPVRAGEEAIERYLKTVSNTRKRLELNSHSLSLPSSIIQTHRPKPSHSKRRRDIVSCRAEEKRIIPDLPVKLFRINSPRKDVASPRRAAHPRPLAAVERKLPATYSQSPNNKVVLTRTASPLAALHASSGSAEHSMLPPQGCLSPEVGPPTSPPAVTVTARHKGVPGSVRGPKAGAAPAAGVVSTAHSAPCSGPRFNPSSSAGTNGHSSCNIGPSLTSLPNTSTTVRGPERLQPPADSATMCCTSQAADVTTSPSLICQDGAIAERNFVSGPWRKLGKSEPSQGSQAMPDGGKAQRMANLPSDCNRAVFDGASDLTSPQKHREGGAVQYVPVEVKWNNSSHPFPQSVMSAKSPTARHPPVPSIAQAGFAWEQRPPSSPYPSTSRNPSPCVRNTPSTHPSSPYRTPSPTERMCLRPPPQQSVRAIPPDSPTHSPLQTPASASRFRLSPLIRSCSPSFMPLSPNPRDHHQAAPVVSVSPSRNHLPLQGPGSEPRFQTPTYFPTSTGGGGVPTCPLITSQFRISPGSSVLPSQTGGSWTSHIHAPIANGKFPYFGHSRVASQPTQSIPFVVEDNAYKDVGRAHVTDSPAQLGSMNSTSSTPSDVSADEEGSQVLRKPFPPMFVHESDWSRPPSTRDPLATYHTSKFPPLETTSTSVDLRQYLAGQDHLFARIPPFEPTNLPDLSAEVYPTRGDEMDTPIPVKAEATTPGNSTPKKVIQRANSVTHRRLRREVSLPTPSRTPTASASSAALFLERLRPSGAGRRLRPPPMSAAKGEIVQAEQRTRPLPPSISAPESPVKVTTRDVGTQVDWSQDVEKAEKNGIVPRQLQYRLTEELLFSSETGSDHLSNEYEREGGLLRPRSIATPLESSQSTSSQAETPTPHTPATTGSFLDTTPPTGHSSAVETPILQRHLEPATPTSPTPTHTSASTRSVVPPLRLPARQAPEFIVNPPSSEGSEEEVSLESHASEGLTAIRPPLPDHDPQFLPITGPAVLEPRPDPVAERIQPEDALRETSSVESLADSTSRSDYNIDDLLPVVRTQVEDGKIVDWGSEEAASGKYEEVSITASDDTYQPSDSAALLQLYDTPRSVRTPRAAARVLARDAVSGASEAIVDIGTPKNDSPDVMIPSIESLEVEMEHSRNDIFDSEDLENEAPSGAIEKLLMEVENVCPAPQEDATIRQTTRPYVSKVDPVAAAHVILLDADDTLIPTSELCEEKYLDQELSDLPFEFQQQLELLDGQLTRLFEQLHSMVVFENLGETTANYVLSVVIITNATLSHIQTTFEKFLPRLTAFFKSRSIKIDELVCSARDIWSDEFPFEHFYEFWKAWTLEDILRELKSDGVPAVTVLTIGDDEPERKAAAYVEVEIEGFVQGVKVVKMVGQPKIRDLIVQLEYINSNVRRYVESDRAFDLRYEMSHFTSGSGMKRHKFPEGQAHIVTEVAQIQPPDIPDRVEALFISFEIKYEILFDALRTMGQQDVLRFAQALKGLKVRQATELAAFKAECRSFLRVCKGTDTEIQIPSLADIVSDFPADSPLAKNTTDETRISNPLHDSGNILNALQNVVKFLLQYPNLVTTLPTFGWQLPSNADLVVSAVHLFLAAVEANDDVENERPAPNETNSSQTPAAEDQM